MLLVLSQRDIKHPSAGGAEVYTHNALKLLAGEREVIHLAVKGPGMPDAETIDGIQYLRKGSNLFDLIWQGYRYYRRRRSEIEWVIDHSNTHQFFTFLWARGKRIFFIHQLTQEIWTYFYGQALGRAAWMLENVLLRLSRGPAITVSESTRKDLQAKGFGSIYLCREGNRPKRTELPDRKKEGYFIYVGRLMPYKRVEDAIRMSAELNKKLIIIGRGQAKYEAKLKRLAESLKGDCAFKGYLPQDEKDRLIEGAELLIMPSVREGWGLVITEAGNLGTPSLVYDVPGTSEAVDYGKAGFIAGPPGWRNLVEAYRSITPQGYEAVRLRAFDFSLTLSWDITAVQFRDAIDKISDQKKAVGRCEPGTQDRNINHSL